MKAVQAREVEFRHGSHLALGLSSFDIPTSRITALIGPNGSGKSTLLNGIAGLRHPSRGALRVLGGDPDEMRRRVSYVLQISKVNELMPVTVREVVTMGRYASTGLVGRLTAADRRAIEHAMARMDIVHLASRHLSELSGGERQRVFVAQGLAQDHELLLLDEPLTGLDVVSAETIDAVIHEEQERGGTVVLTTHDLAEARAADHVLLLAGRVVAEGPPDQVLTDANLAAAYGSAILHFEPGYLMDDPAHTAAETRHIHLERGKGD